MKKHIKYFIAYYGSDHAMAWDNDNNRWVPYDMKLYISTWDKPEDVFPVVRKVKKACSGWYDDIYIDSRLAYIDLN